MSYWLEQQNWLLYDINSSMQTHYSSFQKLQMHNLSPAIYCPVSLCTQLSPTLKLTGFWVFSTVNFVSSLAAGIAATSLQEPAVWGVVLMRRSLKAGGSRMLLHQLSGHLTLRVSLSHPASCTGDHNRFDLFPWTRLIHFNIRAGGSLSFSPRVKR